MKMMLLFIFLVSAFFNPENLNAIVSAGFLMEERSVKAAGVGDALLIELFENQNMVKFGHIIKWNNVNYETIGFNYFKERIGNIGLEMVVQHQKEFTIINSTGDIIGSESIYDFSLAAEYGRNIIAEFDGGIRVKYIKCKLVDRTSETIAFDFVGGYRLKHGIYLNMSTENIGYGLKFDETSRLNNPLPSAFKIGINFLSERKIFAKGILKNFNLYLNARYYVYEGLQTGVGSEYRIKKLIFIRSGYKYFPENDLVGITTGIGFNYKKLCISYAFIPGEVMGNIHKISLKYNW